ncbi:O-antigen ligase family protein [Candidatus Pelagibacter ubique]|nr:O-antigen ligase family protein [Candidatus Pelagibacter ubique]
MNNKILNFYFLFLFSFIPASIIIGPAISLFNILLIDFSFIFLIFYKKDFRFLSNKTVKLIIFLCLYLVFNSIIAKDFSMSAVRNFGFIRFGILFLAFNYFFYNNKNFVINVLATWLLTLSLLSLDTYKESIYGTNILGYGEAHGSRIVSFFKDEPIVGGYIHGFYLMITGYLFFLDKNISNKYKYIILVFSIFFLIAIILTGERSNAIKAIFGFFLFYFINDYFKFKEKIFSILLLALMIIFLLNNSDFLKLRYGGQFFKPIASFFQTNNELNKEDEFKDNIYIRLYQSGFEVFKRYKFFGVGNKNYRVETCSNKKNPKYVCNTHPHQMYFEFLAEHGIAGTVILIFILFSLILSKIKIIFCSKNYLQLGCLTFLLTLFVPLLPSGAFFADYNLTFFWINLSIMYAVGEKTNVYRSN